MHLDHVTIRTGNLPAAREFFLTVFDLEERPRPAAIRRIPGHWLYAGNEPLVHLIGSRGARHGSNLDRAAEAIDHVGFRLEDYAGFRARLDRLGLSYSLMDLPELEERRVFLRAPGGPLLEAVFSEPIPSSREQSEAEEAAT